MRDVVLGALELGLAHVKVVVELEVGVGVIVIPKRGLVVAYRHATVGKVGEVVEQARLGTRWRVTIPVGLQDMARHVGDGRGKEGILEGREVKVEDYVLM